MTGTEDSSEDRFLDIIPQAASRGSTRTRQTGSLPGEARSEANISVLPMRLPPDPERTFLMVLSALSDLP
jgi:hypothetical protein